MTDAQTLIRETRQSLERAHQELRDHPFIKAVGAGNVPEQALRAFPGHQYSMYQSDVRSAASLVKRFGDHPAGVFFLDQLQGEIAAKDGLLAFGRKLGMSEADLAAYEPSGEGFAYAAFVAWLAVYGSAAENACGLLVNLEAWGHNCGVLSTALRERYGFAPEDTAFLDGFAASTHSQDQAMTIIQNDLDAGVEPWRVQRAARLIECYERLFWDAMARATGVS